MSNRLKDIKLEIEKQAQGADESFPVRKNPKNPAEHKQPAGIPQRRPAAQTAVNHPVGGPGGPMPVGGPGGQVKKMPGSTAPAGSRPVSSPSSSVPAVKEMQAAILNLANIASSSDVTSMQGNQEGKQVGQQTRNLPYTDVGGAMLPGNPYDNDKEFLGGNDPFGNFIVQNYIPKDSVAGKQFLNVDVAGGKNRMDASIKPANLRGIIDSIKRVGTPGSEKSVDGIWQSRTNNSLHLIADLVSAMINLTKDMRIPVEGFTEEQLKAFKAKIPAAYTEMKSPYDIAQRAKALTPDLNSIATFFTNLKPAVLENKEIRKFVDQKEPFAKYVNSKFPGEMALFRLPGINLGLSTDPNKNQVSLNDLSSVEKFKEFVQRQGLAYNDNEQLKKILDMISKKLNADVPGTVSKTLGF